MHDDEHELRQLRYRYRESLKNKKKIRFFIDHRLRFPITWTFFFAIAGIIQQSIENKRFVFEEFFYSNLINWAKSFESFNARFDIWGLIEILVKILDGWYYFFFLGGIISIIWAIIRIIFQKKPKESII